MTDLLALSLIAGLGSIGLRALAIAAAARKVP